MILVTLATAELQTLDRDADGQYHFQARSGAVQWQENSRPPAILAENPEDLKRSAFLSIDKGKRKGAVRCDYPEPGALGTRFYFLRALPDGSSLVAPGDERLLFEMTVGGRKIEAKFNLRKMTRLGRIEI